ncbi:MAG: histidinol-phosphatase [Clostridia bacterium]|nr:histidinol-phosphatase [Clostridia bacterium]
MILKDLHVHTTFCDGQNTPEEMVLAAIEKGMQTIGFSGHSHTSFDESYCMTLSVAEEYRKEIERLKKKYAGKIEVLCGVELDLYSDEDPSLYDYVIGSAHYVKANEKYYSVDHSPETFSNALSEGFKGDAISFADTYFETVSLLCERFKPDIIGHFDLVSKFSEVMNVLDRNDPRYINAWKKAADKLMTLNAPFEINTGAISRGFRTFPYPDLPIIEYIKSKGGRFVLSSDSHSVKTLCYGFSEYEYLL